MVTNDRNEVSAILEHLSLSLSDLDQVKQSKNVPTPN